jgi:probable HAF family extracellular repeat protein
MRDLGTLGGTNSVAYGINNAGQVVGGADTAGDATEDAFLYSGGKMIDLGNLGGGTSFANSINSAGMIVGFSYVPAGSPVGIHAFLYCNGTLSDLNSQIPSSSGWTLIDAESINDSGQIVGYGLNANGDHDAFLLTPESSLPEPGTAAIAAMGAFLILARRR